MNVSALPVLYWEQRTSALTCTHTISDVASECTFNRQTKCQRRHDVKECRCGVKSVSVALCTTSTYIFQTISLKVGLQNRLHLFCHLSNLSPFYCKLVAVPCNVPPQAQTGFTSQTDWLTCSGLCHVVLKRHQKRQQTNPQINQTEYVTSNQSAYS